MTATTMAGGVQNLPNAKEERKVGHIFELAQCASGKCLLAVYNFWACGCACGLYIQVAAICSGFH